MHQRPWIRKAVRRPWLDTPAEFADDKFYHSVAWRALRRLHLSKHPLCEECMRNGYHKAGYVVDHIIPIRQGGDKLSESNLQTLCESCHNRKRANERSDRRENDT